MTPNDTQFTYPITAYVPVYDFCLTKRMVTDKETKMTFLQMQWASQSNCDQRKGMIDHASRN